jgi:transcriptional repressor NrdR
MKCPFCRSEDTEVYNTRTPKFANQIWRRRRCQSCHEAFTTYEAADLGFMRVVDAHGHKTRYSRSQLFSAIYQAFVEIPRKDATIDAVTDTIEAKVLDLQQTEVSSGEVTRIVLSTLKHFYTAAFLRYLSSHADLANSAQLKKELKKY